MRRAAPKLPKSTQSSVVGDHSSRRAFTFGDCDRYQLGHKGTDLSALQGKIESYLQSEGFSVQTSAPSAHGTVIQAKKGGFLSGIIAANRALSILVSGDSNDFTVRIGIGKWLEHLGVAALETLLLSELFLVVDFAEMAWNLELEDKLAKQIESFVG